VKNIIKNPKFPFVLIVTGLLVFLFGFWLMQKDNYSSFGLLIAVTGTAIAHRGHKLRK
jgi:hypothetical membrane protein